MSGNLRLRDGVCYVAMFETAILNTPRRPWTLAASLTLQSAAAASVVLLSIITIEGLPMVTLPTPMPPVPAAPKPVEIVGTIIERVVRAQPTGIFTAPVRIPQRVAMIVEEVAPGNVSGATDGLVGTGLPAGMYAGVANSVYNQSTFTAPPPPPSKPGERTVAEAPVTRITVGGNVLQGKLIRPVTPVYPPLARQARISGTVKLNATVGRDGKVRELKVISGHPLLAPAAIEAVRQWLYQPTLLNGEPVEVNAPIEVHFTLN